MATHGRNPPNPPPGSPKPSTEKRPTGAPMGDPALDRPKQVTDTFKNIDIPYGAFSINNPEVGWFYILLVLIRSFFKVKKIISSTFFPYLFALFVAIGIWGLIVGSPLGGETDDYCV